MVIYYIFLQHLSFFFFFFLIKSSKEMERDCCSLGWNFTFTSPVNEHL